MALGARAPRPLSSLVLVSVLASCASAAPPASSDGQGAAEDAAEDDARVAEDQGPQRPDVIAPTRDVIVPATDVVTPARDVVTPGPDASLDVADGSARDSGLDAGTDTGRDAAIDAPADARPDVAPDVAPDVRPDVALDVALDVRPDVTLDVTLDVRPDVRPDVPADVAPDVRPDAGADAASPCPGTQRLCGGICAACPTEGVATTLCSGPFCLAETCSGGYGLSGGMCTPRACPAGQLYCTSRCADCPTVGVVSTRCTGAASCGARVCAAGYELNAATNECITAGVVFELLAPTGANGFDRPGLALGVDGTPYVAFAAPVGSFSEGRLAARARVGGVWRPANADSYEMRVGTPFAISVDPMANLHLAFPNRAVTYRSYDAAGALRVTNVFDSGEAPALALDASVNVHLISKNFPRLEYRRTFAGSWLAPVSVELVVAREPDIAVDASGVAHVGVLVFASGQHSLTYLRAASGTLSPPAQTVFAGYPDQLRIFADTGGAPEIWFSSLTTTPEGSGAYYRSVITAGAPSAPVRWAAPTPGTQRLIGSLGPRGFAALVAETNGYLFRTGPVTGATTSTPLALPRDLIFVGRAIYDAAGNFHVLAVSGGALFYLRIR